MDVDSIVDGWRAKGMTVHKVCTIWHPVAARHGCKAVRRQLPGVLTASAVSSHVHA